MKPLYLAAVLLSVSIFAGAGRALAHGGSCTPVMNSSCIMTHCLVTVVGTPDPYVVTAISPTDCARCSTTVANRINHPGFQGTCQSPSECHGCNACIYYTSITGCPDEPPLCDVPVSQHGPPVESADLVETDLLIGESAPTRTRPPTFTFSFRDQVFIVMRYEPRKGLIEEFVTDDGLMCFTRIGYKGNLGSLGKGRGGSGTGGMGGPLLELVNYLNGNDLGMLLDPPRVSLTQGNREAPYVLGDPWEVRIIAVPPVQLRPGAPLFFPESTGYPCLFKSGRPAGITALRNDGGFYLHEIYD